MATRHVRFARTVDPYSGPTVIYFRGGALSVPIGGIADLTDEEIAAHPEAVFRDVAPASSLVGVLTDGAVLYDQYGNPLATGSGGSGAPGTSFRTGHGAPANTLGINGDTYLDEDTDNLYGPKVAGVWGSSVGSIHGLVGATGPQGAAGTAGIPGSPGVGGHSLLSGHGAPAAGTGADGDSYLDLDTGDLYGPKTGGAWGAISGNLHGAVGATGAAGNVELAYVESASPLSVGTTPPSAGANANVADVPGMSIAVTAPARPFYLWASAIGQLGKGTGATGGVAQLILAIYDVADLSVPVGEMVQSMVIAVTGLQFPLNIMPTRVSLPQGTLKTYKLTAWAGTLPANNAGSLQVPNTGCKIKLGATVA